MWFGGLGHGPERQPTAVPLQICVCSVLCSAMLEVAQPQYMAIENERATLT